MNIRHEIRTWGPFLPLLLPVLVLLGYLARPQNRQVRLDATLIAAVHSHDTNAATEALNAGANPNARDYYRPLPTLLICLRHPDAAREDDQVHAHEWEPVLNSAVIFGWDGGPSNKNEEIVQALLKHGANINGPDFAGDRVLSSAANQGRLDWVGEFMDGGADAGSKAEAVSSAVSANQPAIVSLLIAHGADINAQDRFGYTPLTWSCTIHETAMTRLLLSLGADPSRKDHDGRTALQIAVAEGRKHPDPALVQLLKQQKPKKPTSSPRSQCPS